MSLLVVWWFGGYWFVLGVSQLGVYLSCHEEMLINEDMGDDGGR